jgi:hypothetical protein
MYSKAVLICITLTSVFNKKGLSPLYETTNMYSLNSMMILKTEFAREVFVTCTILCREELRKIKGTLTQNNQRYKASNLGPPEYDARMLTRQIM